jgi:hypothetical protein
LAIWWIILEKWWHYVCGEKVSMELCCLRPWQIQQEWWVHASEYIVPCVTCLSSWYNLKFAILETPSQLFEVCESNCDWQLKT